MQMSLLGSGSKLDMMKGMHTSLRATLRTAQILLQSPRMSLDLPMEMVSASIILAYGVCDFVEGGGEGEGERERDRERFCPFFLEPLEPLAPPGRERAECGCRCQRARGHVPGWLDHWLHSKGEHM